MDSTVPANIVNAESLCRRLGGEEKGKKESIGRSGLCTKPKGNGINEGLCGCGCGCVFMPEAFGKWVLQWLGSVVLLGKPLTSLAFYPFDFTKQAYWYSCSNHHFSVFAGGCEEASIFRHNSFV